MLLPQRKDIDRAKQVERKADIDQGIVLARSVDELRSRKLTLEQSFEVWRKGASEAIQKELDILSQEKETLKTEIVNAKELRDSLLVPLDDKWKEVNDEVSRLALKDENLKYLEEELKIKLNEVENTKHLIGIKLDNLSSDEIEVSQTKHQISRLKVKAISELLKATNIRERQEEEYEFKMNEVSNLKSQYDVALQTMEIRESQVEAKEKDLSNRERALQDKYETLQRTINRTKI
jgi:DNA repair exonuclease SbcCD ATPase subunit